jgi:hypothetical protein
MMQDGEPRIAIMPAQKQEAPKTPEEHFIKTFDTVLKASLKASKQPGRYDLKVVQDFMHETFFAINGEGKTPVKTKQDMMLAGVDLMACAVLMRYGGDKNALMAGTLTPDKQAPTDAFYEAVPDFCKNAEALAKGLVLTDFVETPMDKKSIDAILEKTHSLLSAGKDFFGRTGMRNELYRLNDVPIPSEPAAKPTTPQQKPKIPATQMDELPKTDQAFFKAVQVAATGKTAGEVSKLLTDQMKELFNQSSAKNSVDNLSAIGMLSALQGVVQKDQTAICVKQIAGLAADGAVTREELYQTLFASESRLGPPQTDDTTRLQDYMYEYARYSGSLEKTGADNLERALTSQGVKTAEGLSQTARAKVIESFSPLVRSGGDKGVIENLQSVLSDGKIGHPFGIRAELPNNAALSAQVHQPHAHVM